MVNAPGVLSVRVRFDAVGVVVIIITVRMTVIVVRMRVFVVCMIVIVTILVVRVLAGVIVGMVLRHGRIRR